MAAMASEGPSDRELDEAKKYLVKHHGEKTARDANSLRARNTETSDFVRYGVSSGYDYAGAVNKVSAADVRKFAARLAEGDKFVAIYREE